MIHAGYSTFSTIVAGAGRCGGYAVKIVAAGLFVIMIGGAAFTAVLVRRPARPLAAAPAEKPVEPEHFAGAADTLSPEELRKARLRNKIEMAEWQRQQDELQRRIERRVEIARARPRSVRLPREFKWGRCLLVVQGQTRISGRCAYSIDRNGDFGIEGPRQIYGGIDYPDPEYGYQERSNDFWASIFRTDGIWTGYGNQDKMETKGSGPEFGPLRRRGSCWVSKTARICLWKS
jgi:hypothetical protein